MTEMLKRALEMLDETILCASNIFIVGHNEPDYDAIASALGLAKICQTLEKKVYIIVDDDDIVLEPGVKRIIDTEKHNYNIIKQKELMKLKNKDSLLITVDVNKKNKISVQKCLNDFRDILIIDHHKEDENTIKTNKKIIDLHVSSTSETICELLNIYKIKFDKSLASYLLAGIILDTQRYIKNTSSRTYDIAKKLVNKGADTEYVNSLFCLEYNTDKEISLLIHTNENTKFQKYDYTCFDEYNLPLFNEYNVSFTINRDNPNKIYKSIVLAKAADKMITYSNIDAAFVLGYINEKTVSISARSSGKIDVGEIMHHMNGGGNIQNAATRIEKCEDIFKLEKELIEKTEWGINLEPNDDVKKLIKK